jgi:hypothetical protein
VPDTAAGAGVAAFGAEHAARSKVKAKVEVKAKAKVEVKCVLRLEADLNRRVASFVALMIMEFLVIR